MAHSVRKSIHRYYSDQIPIEIECVKEPDHMTIGTASGIM